VPSLAPTAPRRGKTELELHGWYRRGRGGDRASAGLRRATPVGAGATDGLVQRIRKRRSNIVDYVFDDLTMTSLDRSSFELAVAVEVIEHVEDDESFVANLRSVLKDGGCAVITTPNGDFVRNNNPDHVRHYKKEELSELLRRHFSHVDVWYAVMQDDNMRRGMQRWSVKRPFRTLGSFYGNWRNARMHRLQDIAGTSEGTLHLLAVVTC
jgi:SAM-dependent methyltransferase